LKRCSNCDSDEAYAYWEQEPVCDDCFNKLALDREMETRSDDY